MIGTASSTLFAPFVSNAWVVQEMLRRSTIAIMDPYRTPPRRAAGLRPKSMLRCNELWTRLCGRRVDVR